MSTRELFKRRVIELIHGLPYEDCWLGEWAMEKHSGNANVRKPALTIGRVMKAIGYKIDYLSIEYTENVLRIDNYKTEDKGFLVLWKLTKENCSECTDDDQTDETIEKLYELIK